MILRVCLVDCIRRDKRGRPHFLVFGCELRKSKINTGTIFDGGVIKNEGDSVTRLILV